ncbi:AtpZ/AtpI family protein [Pedobacter sp. PWIIR3]
MNNKKKQVSNFAKYSSISVQMLVTIGVFAFAGYKLDAHLQSKSPIFTALLSLAGVLISLYQVVRQLNKKEE